MKNQNPALIFKFLKTYEQWLIASMKCLNRWTHRQSLWSTEYYVGAHEASAQWPQAISLVASWPAAHSPAPLHSVYLTGPMPLPLQREFFLPLPHSYPSLVLSFRSQPMYYFGGDFPDPHPRVCPLYNQLLCFPALSLPYHCSHSHCLIPRAGTSSPLCHQHLLEGLTNTGCSLPEKERKVEREEDKSFCTRERRKRTVCWGLGRRMFRGRSRCGLYFPGKHSHPTVFQNIIISKVHAAQQQLPNHRHNGIFSRNSII